MEDPGTGDVLADREVDEEFSDVGAGELLAERGTGDLVAVLGPCEDEAGRGDGVLREPVVFLLAGVAAGVGPAA